jgi:hypothetical protein
LISHSTSAGLYVNSVESAASKIAQILPELAKSLVAQEVCELAIMNTAKIFAVSSQDILRAGAVAIARTEPALEIVGESNVPVFNITDQCIDEVADHTLAFMLGVIRRNTRRSTQMAATSRRKALNYATILENHVDVRDSDDISQLEPKRCRIPIQPKSSA